MLNNLGLLSTIAKSFIRHHQCIIIYEIYALLLQEAHTRNKKMTYLNIFLIVFEQERTRRKKERITPPPLLPVSLVVTVQYFLSSRSPEKRNRDKMIIQCLSYTYIMK